MKWLSTLGTRWLWGALVLCFSALNPVAAQNFKSGSFTTSDGVKINYLEAGSGPPMVLIPGWSQTAIQFKHQLTGLSDKFHVYALDMRGHGDSDKPKHGYRIHRLSADVHEFLVGKNLKNVVLGGHSMGCSVIWGYWELYGGDRVSKLLLIDQMPMITMNPAWSDQEKQDAGSIFDGKSLYDTMNALAGPDGVKVTEGFITGMIKTLNFHASMQLNCCMTIQLTTGATSFPVSMFQLCSLELKPAWLVGSQFSGKAA